MRRLVPRIQFFVRPNCAKPSMLTQASFPLPVARFGSTHRV